jgi:hypothetical protein
MLDGGRVVITYAPVGKNRDLFDPGEDVDEEEREEETEADEGGEAEESEAEISEEAEQDETVEAENSEDEGKDDQADRSRKLAERYERYMADHWTYISDRWDVKFAFKNLVLSVDKVYTPEEAVYQGDGDLPANVPWHSALYFEPDETIWRTVYARDDLPVIIERDYGPGTLVLCADSYFLSNESLRKDRAATLLAWLVQPRGPIVFDETVHGIDETQGLMLLARRYRLHGVIGGFLLLALLYIWKNAVSLVPRELEDDEIAGERATEGRDTAAGLTNLVKRSVVPSRLIAVCIEEWQRARAAEGQKTLTEDKHKRILAAADTDSPAAAYQAIAAVVNERKH